MEAQVQQLQEALEALQQKVCEADAAHAHPPAKFVYAARKMSKFDGARDKLDDWLQEARSTITNMGLIGQDASEFLITHLEGEAELEVKVLLVEKQFGDGLGHN
jgi:hypothetical protein